MMIMLRKIIVILFAICAFAQVSNAQTTPASDEEEKSSLILYVEETLSAPNRQIRLNGLVGALSSKVELTSITISDEDGIWLEIISPVLDWNRSALITGRLEINSLTADTINFARGPKPDDSLPSAETSSFTLPELPVSISIDELAIGRINLGAPLLGFEASTSLNGRMKLADGALDAMLDATRLDGPGGALQLETFFAPNDNNQLKIVLNVQEPKDGILATALKIPDTPAIDLSVAGEGPLEAFDLAISLDADRARVLNGTVELRDRRDGLSAMADISGQLAVLVEDTFKPLLKGETALQLLALFSDSGAMSLDRLALKNDTLDLQGSGIRSAEGDLQSLNLTGVLADQSGVPLALPFGEPPAKVQNVQLKASFDGLRTNIWSLGATLNELDLTDTKVAGVKLAGQGEIQNGTDTLPRTISFDIGGSATGMVLADPNVTDALAKGATFAAQGLYTAEQDVTFNSVTARIASAVASFKGSLKDLKLNGEYALSSSDLAPLGAIAGQKLAGIADIKANGTVQPTNGAFDLTLNGQLANFATDIAPLDQITGGNVALSGAIARGENGLVINQVTVKADHLDAVIDGALASDQTNIAAEIALDDLARLSDQISGAANASITLNGQNESRALVLDAQIPNGRVLGKNLTISRLGFDGRLEGQNLIGDIVGKGNIGGDAINLTGALNASAQQTTLNDLIFQIGATRLNADIARQSSGLLTGALNINSPNVAPLAALALQDISGSLNGNVNLQPSGSRQNISVDLSSSNIATRGVTIRNADIAGQIADALGNWQWSGNVNASGISQSVLDQNGIAPLNLTSQLSANATSVEIAGANISNAQALTIALSGGVPLKGGALSLVVNGQAPLELAAPFLASRGATLSGNARFNLNIGGPLSAPQPSGILAIDDATLTDPLSNLRLTNIGILAGLSADQIAINQASANLSGGGSVTARGTVGITGNFPANVDISLINARYTDGEIVAATASGALNLSGGMLTDPLLSGTINIENAEITVPESLPGSVSSLNVTNINPSADVAATLQRIEQASPTPTPSARPSVARIDLQLLAPARIFVRGRGIDAELGGRLKITGPVTALVPIGAFELRRGRVAILGRRIEFESGTMRLIGSFDPIINFTASTRADDITAIIRVIGSASNPEVVLTSTPELPQDEVFARFVFGKSIADLSPTQIARLAVIASELAGGGESPLLSQLRSTTGLDDIDIVSDEEGNVGVRAGRYVADNVYLGVEVGQETEATINLDVTEDITVRGAVGTGGDSSVGVFFERDY